MEKEKFIQKKEIWIVVSILIFLAMAVTLIPVFIPIDQFKNNYAVLFWFLGINSVLIVIGTFSLAFYLIWQWIIGINYQKGETEKQKDKEEKQKQQDVLFKDTEERRELERERNQINDMFRLFELAKEKPEEIKDKTKEKEEGALKKQIDKDVSTNKNEKINTDTLQVLIEGYQNFFKKQRTKSS